MQHFIYLAPHSVNLTFQTVLVRVEMGFGGRSVVDRVAGLPQLGIIGALAAVNRAEVDTALLHPVAWALAWHLIWLTEVHTLPPNHKSAELVIPAIS